MENKNNLKFWINAIDRLCDLAKDEKDAERFEKLKNCSLLFRKYLLQELKTKQKNGRRATPPLQKKKIK